MDFMDDMYDLLDPEIKAWIFHEKHVYRAHAGRDGTREGFLKHISERIDKISEDKREKIGRAIVGACVDAMIEREGWP
jgi:hypothetical protein